MTAPVLQITQKIPENYSPSLYLYQMIKFGEVMSCRSKDIFKNASSGANTHHDVTDLVSQWHLLRSYHFEAVVVFNTCRWLKTDRWLEDATYFRARVFHMKFQNFAIFPFQIIRVSFFTILLFRQHYIIGIVLQKLLNCVPCHYKYQQTKSCYT